MGEVAAAGVRKPQVEAQLCLAAGTAFVEENDVEDEREKAVAAAVEVVAASARCGVVALCASVAHIIRKNFRLQQQVVELEGRIRELETLAGLPENTSAFNQCQYSAGSQGPEYSSANSQECSSATSQCPSTSESLPESPSSQRCGSAPPHYPPGSLRPYQCHGPALRKASDPEGGTGFLRGHTRASTGNLSHCGPGVTSSFVRRKYSSISLRRVRRTPAPITPFTGRQGSQRGSSGSLEQQQATNSTTSSKSCVITVAEVYPSPDTTTTTTTTEGDAVKLLAQKLTTVLQDDSTNTQEDTDNLVLCAPHPLAGCECVVCQQLATHPDVLPYEIVTDEGSLLPRGSTVLVSGQRVGTVVYFGHSRQQGKATGTPHRLKASPLHHQGSSTPTTSQPHYQQVPLLSAPDLSDAPAEDGQLRSVSSPIGVTVVLWLPDEGEVFVPLNDVICQLDDEVTPGHPEEQSSLVEEEGDRRLVCGEVSPTNTPMDGTYLDHTLTDTQDTTGGMAQRNGLTEDSLLSVEDCSGIESSEKPYRHSRRRSVSASNCMYVSQELRDKTLLLDKGGRTTDTGPKTPVLLRMNSTDATLRRTPAIGMNHSLPSSPRHTRQRGESGNDPEAHYTEGDKGKLQFGDTWDSGCYMSVGRHSSECSEQFSDLESEYGSTPWASSLEEALDCVWKRHRPQDTQSLSHSLFPRRQPTATFFVDREIELQEYRAHKKARDDTLG